MRRSIPMSCATFNYGRLEGFSAEELDLWTEAWKRIRHCMLTACHVSLYAQQPYTNLSPYGSMLTALVPGDSILGWQCRFEAWDLRLDLS